MFGNLILTDLGAGLMGKVAAGGTLQFNRVGIGDGTWPGGVGDPAWTALISEKISFSVQSIVNIDDGMATATAIMLHDDLIAAGFYATEFGIFAQDPDLGEILYAMAYAGAEASWIPAATGVPSYQHAYTIGISIGNATTVTVQVDSSTVTVTLAQFQSHEALELNPADTDATKNKHLSNAQANGWVTNLAANAAAISTHAASTSPHGATSAATASRIIIRDSAGRAKIAAPSASDDIARKAEVDAEASVRASADLFLTDRILNLIPYGTRMLFQQSSAPVGWTKVATHNNKAMRVVSGAVGAGGTVAFTTAFADRTVTATTAGGTVGGTALTISQMPRHRHPIPAGKFQDTDGSNVIDIAGAGVAGDTIKYADYEGDGAAHNHPFTGSSHNHDLNMDVQYVDVIIATKD
jgi:hypothetical protein